MQSSSVQVSSSDHAPKTPGLHDSFQILLALRGAACVLGPGYLQEHLKASSSLAFFALTPSRTGTLSSE